MDRSQIIHDLALEYVRSAMKDFHEMVPPKSRTAQETMDELEGFYISAVAKYSKIPDDALPL